MKSIFTRLPLAVLLGGLYLNASSQTNHLVISQLFGSGGVSATLPNNDFIELYNPTGAAINLNGWSVQFAFGSATTYTKIPLSGNILAKGYYLIQLGRDAMYTGKAMPTPDLTFNYNINSPNMKVGLYNFTGSVTGANPSATAVDFVGTGAATGYETAPSSQGAYNVSLMRKSSSVSTAATMSGTGTEYRNGNGYDTDNNSADLLLTSNVVARSANSSPLAVSFLSLDLVATTTGNRLRWLVDEAKDVRLFEVEKSADGLSFFRIGQVSPQAATACQFVDAGSGAAAYYRIKAVTKDDRQQYSATLFVEGQQTALMKVYPSIASNYLHLQLPVTAGGVLFIYTMDGRLQQQITLAERQALVRLSLASLKPGAYLIRYIAGSGCTAVERFVKAG